MSTPRLRFDRPAPPPPAQMRHGLPPAKLINHPEQGRVCPVCGRRVEFWSEERVCVHPRS